ncbi:hypothetical protein ABT297_40095 [Dactylosporangium sp. NPDC000555]|uniref:hypothetical protein n=1 Tax=Dactylosporangium sp. NPDC000555 TaxID=3154260 RepID=UPI0033202708
MMAWLEENPQVIFYFTPVGSGWINQIETWFGTLTRQPIRRATTADDVQVDGVPIGNASLVVPTYRPTIASPSPHGRTRMVTDQVFVGGLA